MLDVEASPASLFSISENVLIGIVSPISFLSFFFWDENLGGGTYFPGKVFQAR